MSEAETSCEDAPEAGGVAVVEVIVIEIIDLEEHAKSGKKPPRARRYRIRIDKEYKEVEAPGLTGRQILHLVGKTPRATCSRRSSTAGGSSPSRPTNTSTSPRTASSGSRRSPSIRRRVEACGINSSSPKGTREESRPAACPGRRSSRAGRDGSLSTTFRCRSGTTT